jgi:thiol-disulfide isomerase/thioredoxin
MNVNDIFERLHLPVESRLPEFAGATTWLNSPPLSSNDLHGKVVLADFGTFTCINWIRTLPYVRAWNERYRDSGLVTIGIQTPEFEMEHDVDRVRQSLDAMQVDYPVAVDNDYAIWNAFANSYWPALYFIDREGVIRDEHFGEGRYEESERSIQQLLGVEKDLIAIVGEGIEAPADWEELESPETYLGRRRGERRSEGDPDSLRRNHWLLSGDWTIGEQGAVLDDAHGGIAFRFHARDLHLVLKPGETPVRFRVSLDDGPPGSAHGGDIDESGNGVASEPRLYQLIRQDGRIDDRTFEITFLEPGIEANVFTFG